MQVLYGRGAGRRRAPRSAWESQIQLRKAPRAVWALGRGDPSPSRPLPSLLQPAHPQQGNKRSKLFCHGLTEHGYRQAARRKYRQDQYPATGDFGEFTGAKWHDLFEYDGTLEEEATEMGMRAICAKAGDVLIMPEALTQ